MMKKNLAYIFLCFVLCFVAGISTSCDAPTESVGENPIVQLVSDPEVDELKEEVEHAKQMISNLSAQLNEAHAQLEKEKKKNEELTQRTIGLENENKTLTEQNKKLKEENGTLIGEKERLWYYCTIALLCVIIAILLIVIWRCWIRITNRSTYTEDHTKCPYCGWEHDPGETVCRKCKTKFH